MRLLRYFTILGLATIAPCWAATVTVNTGLYGFTLVAISNAVAIASVDDTVFIPNGDYYGFNKALIIGKAITISGESSNLTVIHDSIPAASRTSTYPGLFYVYATNSTHLQRFTNLKFTHDSTNTAVAFGGAIQGYFRTQLFSVDHVWWYNLRARPLNLYNSTSGNNMGGVIWLCNWTAPSVATSGCFIDGYTPDNGHYSWSQPVDYNATNNWMVFEDNIVSNSFQKAWIDGRIGMRVMFRNNGVTNATIETHEILGASRGPRALAIYGNTFKSFTGGSAALLRGGTGIMASNNVNGFQQLIQFVSYRSLSSAGASGTHPFGWYGCANGTNSIDLNGPQLASGTVGGASTSPSNKVLVDTNQFWSPDNKWKGYTAINTITGRGGLIESSTSNSLALYFDDGQAQGTSSETYWTNGNTYVIGSVTKAIDQVGAGRGDLLVGGSSSVRPTPWGWPHQADEPVYIWGNTGSSTIVSADRYNRLILEGRDFTNAVPAGFIGLPYPHPVRRLIEGLPQIVLPTIAAIADQTILQNDNTGPLAVTIGAGATNVNNYTLAYTSSNPSLVPNGAATNVVFGGSGANRTVTIYPVTGQNGTTAMAITVTDEVGNQAARAFVLNVSGANTPPTITSIVNQTLLLSSSTGALPFTVGDLETSPGSLTVTATSSDTNCIPSASVTLGGSGASRNVTVLSGLVYGFSQITLSVSDGTTNATSSFFVNVIPPNPATRVNTKIANIGQFIFQ